MRSKTSTKKSKLDQVQKWFQVGVVGPHESPKTFARRFDANEHVLPSATLTAAERVDLYSQMYLSRMAEALENDYSVVVSLIGHDKYHELVHAYTVHFPSRNYSLNPFGQSLPKLIQKGKVRLPHAKLVLDVARLEAAMQRTFDAPEFQSLSAADFSKVSATAWERARLEFVPAFELLAFDYPANAVVTATKQEKPLPPLRAKKTWVAVYRKQYAVWRMDLTEPMFDLLTELAAGKTLLSAIEKVSKNWSGEVQELESEIFRWFQSWANEGFFSRIVLRGR